MSPFKMLPRCIGAIIKKKIILKNGQFSQMFHPKANFWKFPLNLLIVEKDTPKTTGKNPIFRFDWAWDWNNAVYWQPQARQVNSFLLVTRVVFTVNMGTVTLPPVTLMMKQMTISTRTSDFHLLSRPIGFKFFKEISNWPTDLLIVALCRGQHKQQHV